MTLIKREDAIALLTKIVFDEPPYFDSETLCRLYAEEQINTLPSAELNLQTPQTYGKSINPSNAEVVDDLISRADAIDALRMCVVESELLADWNKAMESAQELLSALPSANAEPTVIRCKTMIPYGDFREWAKRIREDNPNVIVIPFDAEVASADAVKGEWIHDGQNFKGGLDWCHCSVCGQKTSTNGLSMYNFCPSCGAKMYKGGDNE